MADEFSFCETGLEELLSRLGTGHPRYTEALTLQSRLLENVAQVRQYGDSENLRSERHRIIAQLNQLSHEELNVSFNRLCSHKRPWSLAAASSEDQFPRLLTSEVIGILSLLLAIWIVSSPKTGVMPLTATWKSIILGSIPLVLISSWLGSLLIAFVARRINGIADSTLTFCAMRSRRDHIEAAAVGGLLSLLIWTFAGLVY